MSNFSGILLALAFGLAAVPASHGQLVFDSKLVEIKAKPDSDLVTAEFRFTVGDKGVTITEYEAACSCLEAKISEGGKLTWKPGEEGTVQGLFKMGTFKGVVDKKIVLRIKGQAHAEELVVRVDVPVLFEVDPPTLFWDLGGEANPQKFKLTVHDKTPIHITEVSGTNEQFQFELKKIKDGWEYEVVVTPTTAETRAFGLLRLRTDSKYKRHQSYQAFMVVRRAKPPGELLKPGQAPAPTRAPAPRSGTGLPTPPKGTGAGTLPKR